MSCLRGACFSLGVSVGQFEYIMALVSVIVGLGITHVLGAIGEIIHRLRGHGAPIKVDAVYLLWVASTLIWLASVWWGEYKLLTDGYVWTFGAYLFLIAYYISLFLVVVILVPVRMDNVADTYEYFMGGRAWFFGAVLIAIILDFFDTALKGAEWAVRPEYLLSQSGVYIACCAIGWFAKNRLVQIAIAAAPLVSQLAFAWQYLNVLGRW